MNDIKAKHYLLTTEQRPAYMYASIRSPIRNRRITTEYVRELVDRCVNNDCSRLLIEKDVDDWIWMWDSLSLIDQFPKAGLSGVKIALIDHSSKGFGKDGFGIKGSSAQIDLHVFDSFVAGERWLVGN